MTSQEKFITSSVSSNIGSIPTSNSELGKFFVITHGVFNIIFFFFIWSYKFVQVAAREKMGSKHISLFTRGVLAVIPFCIGVAICIFHKKISDEFMEVRHFSEARIILAGIIYMYLGRWYWKKSEKLIEIAEDKKVPINKNYPGEYIYDFTPGRLETVGRILPLNKAIHIFFLDPAAVFLGGSLIGIVHPIAAIPFVIVLFGYYPTAIVNWLFGLNGHNIKYFSKNGAKKVESDFTIVH